MYELVALNLYMEHKNLHTKPCVRSARCTQCTHIICVCYAVHIQYNMYDTYITRLYTCINMQPADIIICHARHLSGHNHFSINNMETDRPTLYIRKLIRNRFNRYTHVQTAAAIDAILAVLVADENSTSCLSLWHRHSCSSATIASGYKRKPVTILSLNALVVITVMDLTCMEREKLWLVLLLLL